MTRVCGYSDLIGTGVPSGGPHSSLSLFRSKEREEREKERESLFTCVSILMNEGTLKTQAKF